MEADSPICFDKQLKVVVKLHRDPLSEEQKQNSYYQITRTYKNFI